MELKLVVLGSKHTGMEIPVSGAKFLIGRDAECRLRPQSKSVSRKHCAILIEDGVAVIEDFGSTNGTMVNGEKIAKRRELKNGDRLSIGILELEVRIDIGVGGPKKPKVHSIQEAAARTVAGVPKSEDDLDISSWLDGANDMQSVVSPLKEPVLGQDTIASKNRDDTATIPMPLPEQPAKESEAKPAKGVGRFQRPVKPMAEDSGAAAREMLRQFFPRQK